jgi:sarcosine oxidase subunit gamma
MVEQESPLGPAWKPGSHGKVLGATGVVLEETKPGSIVQIAAFHGEERSLINMINIATGLALPDGAGAASAGTAKRPSVSRRAVSSSSTMRRVSALA